MPQHELNRRIAALTGESLADVARLGFQIDAPPQGFTHRECGDISPIDWDERQAATRSVPHRCGRGRVAFHA